MDALRSISSPATTALAEIAVAYRVCMASANPDEAKRKAMEKAAFAVHFK